MKMRLPKLYVAPMSINMMSTVSFVSTNYHPIGLIASRRQVDWDYGYVEKTKNFHNMMHKISPSTFLCRDHAGPLQGRRPDDGIESLEYDSMYFDFIHIDPFKPASNIEEAADYTTTLIKFCYNKNPIVLFEVGTEQAIFEYSPLELERFLTHLKQNLTPDQFNCIVYACIQSGVGIDLYNRKNTGEFSMRRFKNFIEVVKNFGLYSKEHNGDYLAPEDIAWRFANGLDAINIAPEFVQWESDIVYDNLLENEKYEILDFFFNFVWEFAPWQKWMDKEKTIKQKLNKQKFTTAFSHYLFNTQIFKEHVKRYLTISDGDMCEIIGKKMLHLCSELKFELR